MKKTPATKNAANKAEIVFDNSVEGMRNSILFHLETSLARERESASLRDWWVATAYAIRDRVMIDLIETSKRQRNDDARRIYYMSLEYLVGRVTDDCLVNIGMLETTKKALAELGQNYNDVVNAEVDMGLGNGGLGRLAACFQDSLATLDYPAIGYGIRYEFGLFTQSFENGKQVESPDNWLKYGSPWEIVRPEYTTRVKIGGYVENSMNDKGDWVPVWKNQSEFLGVPWDIPVVGYGARTVNFLRLWESRASNEFDLNAFNEGGYAQAVHEKAMSETISKVLYPNDKTENGKLLRLMQQYFFVSCSLQNIITRYLANHKDWSQFTDKVVIQLNDTHPAIAVPELMRLLVDEHHMQWDAAWSICTKVFAYTNHTLLPEALEKWSVVFFEKLLPRHLQIIYEINSRWLKEVAQKFPNNPQKQEALSIIEESSPKMVRMAYLAVVGSFSVNGVAELHTELLKASVLKDFYEMSPEKFNNKTNGVTPRRWLKVCNPGLSELIDSKIGDGWVTDLDKLKGLEKFADDAKFQKQFMAVKLENKRKMAEIIRQECGVEVNPEAMFDVQIKRLHEYKRQHLKLLHILTLYKQLLHNPDMDIPQRVFIFGAKAAPGYDIAKNIIYAINKVGEKINADKRIKDKLKVVFIPNYKVTSAMSIIPSADLSEQISTAGKEASGTSNMKLALNGAITMGTLDGANVEIKESVGDDNIFIFGMTVEEVQQLRARGYNPWDFYAHNRNLKEVLDWLVSDYFAPNGDTNAFMPLRKSVLDWGDPFMVCADYQAYCDAQAKVDEAFRDKKRWAKMAILNTARIGKFSSDRTIREYAEDIWHLERI